MILDLKAKITKEEIVSAITYAKFGGSLIPDTITFTYKGQPVEIDGASVVLKERPKSQYG